MTPLAPFGAGSVQDDTQRARLHDRLADCDAADLRNRLVAHVDRLTPGDVHTLNRILSAAGADEPFDTDHERGCQWPDDFDDPPAVGEVPY